MNRNAVRDRRLHAVLCAGLSIATLGMVASARAADLFKAPPPPQGETQLWIAGGAFDPGGDAIQYGAVGGGAGGLIVLNGVLDTLCNAGGNLCNNNNDPTVRGVWGWDTSAGFDHRFAGTNWHANGELRFGLARGSASSAEALSLSIGPPPPTVISLSRTDTAALTEWHWQGDLGIGYDVIAGPSPLQVTFGLRLAEINSKVTDNSNGNLSAVCPAPACVPPLAISGAFAGNDVTTRSFLGAGPRIGMVGSIPLFGAWTFDYKGDAALLVGNTKISDDFSESLSLLVPGVISLSATGITSSSYWSKWITVVNGDMQGGIGYWITPNTKLAASLRLDVFLDPLRQNPDDTLPAQGIDRFYWGPQVTLTSKF